MLWPVLGALVSISAALTWWRTSRRTAAITMGLLMAAGILLAGLTGRSAVGDFCAGLMIGLSLLIAQAVRADRADRAVRSIG